MVLRTTSWLAVVSSTLLVGCPASQAEDGGDTETDAGSTRGEASTSTGPNATAQPSSSDASSVTTDDPDTTDAADGSTSSTTGEATEVTGDTETGTCQVWQITYDLAGSEFEISNTPFGAGDQVNTLQEPYDADTNIGPGTFVLQFEDVDGAPGGLGTMVSYAMSLHFVVGGTVTVTTDIEGTAGPEACGVTQGLLAGTTVAWAPPLITDYTTEGQVLCQGPLCSAGGLPNGTPVVQDDVVDQPINDFVFEADLSAFTMAEVVTGQDGNSTNSWTYVGTQTNRELVDAPACACGE